MTVEQLLKKLSAQILICPEPQREVTGFYAGDLLSNVMGHAQYGNAWFTVMTNVNVAGVASLVDASVIVVCEGAPVDGMLLERCKTVGINLIVTQLGIFAACAVCARE